MLIYAKNLFLQNFNLIFKTKIILLNKLNKIKSKIIKTNNNQKNQKIPFLKEI